MCLKNVVDVVILLNRCIKPCKSALKILQVEVVILNKSHCYYRMALLLFIITKVICQALVNSAAICFTGEKFIISSLLDNVATLMSQVLFQSKG